jgi:3-hydroxy acid dehydrogenase/malonic semialdehyde reductase
MSEAAGASSGFRKGDVVVVTGATSGIGEACARRFAAEGARVVVTGRREERLRAIADAIAGHALVLDVRDRQAVERSLSALPPAFADVAVLVNNAGLALGLEPAQRADVDDWQQMVETNVLGLSYVTRTLLPGMVERGRGHIVNIGSVAGSYPYPGGNVYGATKAFVRQFSLNLKADLLGTPVRVTNVEPGMVDTEFSAVRFHGDRERAAAVYANMDPLTAEDIADVVFWSVGRPARVNVNTIEVMPTMQAFSPFAVARRQVRDPENDGR